MLINDTNFGNFLNCQNNKQKIKNNTEQKPQIQRANLDYSIYKNLPYNKIGSFTTLNFGFRLKDAEDAHLDYYGANVKPDGTTSFRVYSDKSKVSLQMAKNNHNIKYWEELTPELKDDIGFAEYPMHRNGNVFEAVFNKTIPDGTLYRFKVMDENKRVSYLKDPRTYHQPNGAMGWSGVYNQNLYSWQDDEWRKGLDKRRITHNGEKNKWGATEGMVIAEKHIGLLGGFEEAKKEIDKIVQDGICNTIHILPLGEFFGDYNLGYDEVDKFAPTSTYGSPNELKALVDYAHQNGINMMLDVVPNHFGFIGASAGQFACSEDEHINTGWGNALKFNGRQGEYMRKFMADMMMNWLVNYHFDGLRVDAVEQLFSDISLKYFASEIRSHPETKDAILIPEHIDKTRKLAQPLKKGDIKNPLRAFETASRGGSTNEGLGYDIQYIYDFKNTLSALILGMQVYDCPPSLDDLAGEYKHGNRFYDAESAHLPELKANNSYIYCNMHDEFIVFGGVRPVVRSLAHILNMPEKDTITSPDCLDKTPYHKAEELLSCYLNGDYDEIRKEGLTIKQFEKAYKQAQAKNRLMLACEFMHPAHKGFSMGDETGELTPMRYFAQYDNDNTRMMINTEKGYYVGEESFKRSCAKYNPIRDKKFSLETTRLSGDFIWIINKNPALKYGDYNKIISDCIGSDSLFIHRWDGDKNDIFAIANFSGSQRTYDSIEHFPDGTWSEILNTDNEKYGGSGKLYNSLKLFSRKNQKITLAPYSLAVFKRADDIS